MDITKYYKYKWIYQNLNPFVALLIASIINLFILIIMLFFILFYRKKYVYFLIYIILIIIIKFIPLYFLFGEPINFITNLLYGGIFFIIYLIYLYFQNTNIFQIYFETFNSIINNKNNTPFLSLVHTLCLEK